MRRIQLPAFSTLAASSQLHQQRFGRGRKHATPSAAYTVNAPSLKSPTQFASGLEEMKTHDPIWEAKTLQDAWKVLHESISVENSEKAQNDEESGEDLASVRENVLKNDLKALAKCSARSELDHLLSCFPKGLKDEINKAPQLAMDTVEEFFFHVGMDAEVRGPSWNVSLPPPTIEDIDHILARVDGISDENRGNIGGTLHRVSLWKDRRRRVLGLTIRVGRYVPLSAAALVPYAQKGNLLILSPPGLGKTTLLRDLAITLAHAPAKPRVIVVDNANEIGGDSLVPLSYFGRVRRMQTANRAEQRSVMQEALGNHTPDIVIVDELASEHEVNTAWTMSQRGIRLIATAHGETLEKLLNNKDLNMLVGGASQAFLSNEERRLRNKTRKTILERPYPSPFQTVVQLVDRNTAQIFVNVNTAVDEILDGNDVTENARLVKIVRLSDGVQLNQGSGRQQNHKQHHKHAATHHHSQRHSNMDSARYRSGENSRSSKNVAELGEELSSELDSLRFRKPKSSKKKRDDDDLLLDEDYTDLDEFGYKA